MFESLSFWQGSLNYLCYPTDKPKTTNTELSRFTISLSVSLGSPKTDVYGLQMFVLISRKKGFYLQTSWIHNSPICSFLEILVWVCKYILMISGGWDHHIVCGGHPWIWYWSFSEQMKVRGCHQPLPWWFKIHKVDNHRTISNELLNWLSEWCLSIEDLYTRSA